MAGYMATATQQIRLPAGTTLDDIPIERVSGRWWRQSSPRFRPLSLAHMAPSGGRCHRKRQQPRLYMSSTQSAAWGELFRHVQAEVSPFEIKRTMSVVRVTNLPVVDFEDPLVRGLFHVSESALVGNDYGPCRRLADLLRTRPDLFGGMILPSAVVPGEQTLVVFREWIPDHLAVVRSQRGSVPVRLLRLLEAITPTLTRDVQTVARRFALKTHREIQDRIKRELDRF